MRLELISRSFELVSLLAGNRRRVLYGFNARRHLADVRANGAVLRLLHRTDIANSLNMFA